MVKKYEKVVMSQGLLARIVALMKIRAFETFAVLNLRAVSTKLYLLLKTEKSGPMCAGL